MGSYEPVLLSKGATSVGYLPHLPTVGVTLWR